MSPIPIEHFVPLTFFFPHHDSQLVRNLDQALSIDFAQPGIPNLEQHSPEHHHGKFQELRALVALAILAVQEQGVSCIR
jgi:hypothetical protein